MKLDEKILQRFDELTQMGEEVLRTKETAFPMPVADAQSAQKWGINCLHLLRKALGEKSDHYQKFSEYCEAHSIQNFHNAEPALGILQAAKEDYEKELLFDVRTLIEAEVFSDFLEQAEYLLRAGYYGPAAVRPPEGISHKV